MNPTRKNPEEYFQVIAVEIRAAKEIRSKKSPIAKRIKGAIGWNTGLCQIAIPEAMTTTAKKTMPRHSSHLVSSRFKGTGAWTVDLEAISSISCRTFNGQPTRYRSALSRKKFKDSIQESQPTRSGYLGWSAPDCSAHVRHYARTGSTS